MIARFFCGVFLVALALVSCARAAEPAAKKIEFAIAVHGGAGIEPDALSPDGRRARTRALGQALDVGRKILADGGAALDAVEQTIRLLEDDPLFNAGRGAVFNAAGGHELDATIMDGRTREGGGVAAVTTVKNPISLARLVMTETKHVLLIGHGAEQFADEMRDKRQIERVPNSYFSTDVRREQWRRKVEEEKAARGNKRASGAATMGTVGCVALDKQGNLAAGTSTGGLVNKRWGRVGDSAILGAGTYADNHSCAVSCTGTGELFIRNAVGFHIGALMAFKGMSLDEAVRQVIDEVLPDDSGGLIAVDAQGNISMRFNTEGMARAAADSRGRVEIMLGK
ncbi:MAG: isoaspartyl peptidase/L-asparaginase [Planctomycetia bacterium]|nr:isoaspartyl peptidase/L-asparaginase [Planctomycetia bacterium]